MKCFQFIEVQILSDLVLKIQGQINFFKMQYFITEIYGINPYRVLWYFSNQDQYIVHKLHIHE